MKTLDKILKDAQYASCWYLRSERLLESNLSDRFIEIGTNEEGWLVEDVSGNPIYSKIDVGSMYPGVEELIKVCFEI